MSDKKSEAPGPTYTLMVEQHHRFASAIVAAEWEGWDGFGAICCPFCQVHIHTSGHTTDCIVNEARSVIGLG